MRGPEDLIQVELRLRAIVSLDRERITEDPVWAGIADSIDLQDPEAVKQALYRYIGQYVAREKKQLFDAIFMPSTNGPADLTIESIEELSNGGSTENNGTSGRSGRDT